MGDTGYLVVHNSIIVKISNATLKENIVLGVRATAVTPARNHTSLVAASSHRSTAAMRPPPPPPPTPRFRRPIHDEPCLPSQRRENATPPAPGAETCLLSFRLFSLPLPLRFRRAIRVYGPDVSSRCTPTSKSNGGISRRSSNSTLILIGAIDHRQPSTAESSSAASAAGSPKLPLPCLCANPPPPSPVVCPVTLLSVSFLEPLPSPRL